ncbi:hypothetical protein EON81_24830 [bacterium]|nr:MAG: hypothetical protein EON81_24830 [bacterium]
MQRRTLLVSLGLVALAGVVYAVQSGASLRINGQVATTDVRMINGRAYAPIADIAKALGQSVVKNGNGYEFAAAGGSNEIGGYKGQQGDVVFTGKWRFQVLDWKRVKSYKPTLSKRDTDEVRAEPGQDLIIVGCRIKNGLKAKDELVFSPNWDGMNTALTAQDEANYQPKRYDVSESEGSPDGTVFLPGGAINFRIVFEVPEGTTPKDLVFTALRYGMRSSYDQKKEVPQNIRVALKADAE